MIWENGIETCISYKKRITSPGSMHDTGCLGLVHWDDPEGWYREGEGGGFRVGNTGTPMAYSCQCMAKPIQYCKVISLQLKYINLYLKKVRVLSCFKIAKQRAYFRCCLVAKSYLTLL